MIMLCESFNKRDTIEGVLIGEAIIEKQQISLVLGQGFN